MPEAIEAKAQQISPRTSEWIEQAQVIVAYPEDFGMTRKDVRGLSRLLQAIRVPIAARPVLQAA